MVVGQIVSAGLLGDIVNLTTEGIGFDESIELSPYLTTIIREANAVNLLTSGPFGGFIRDGQLLEGNVFIEDPFDFLEAITVKSFKLFNNPDGYEIGSVASFESLNEEKVYLTDIFVSEEDNANPSIWNVIGGNGSYCSVTGENMLSGGVGDTYAFVDAAVRKLLFNQNDLTDLGFPTPGSVFHRDTLIQARLGNVKTFFPEHVPEGVETYSYVKITRIGIPDIPDLPEKKASSAQIASHLNNKSLQKLTAEDLELSEEELLKFNAALGDVAVNEGHGEYVQALLDEQNFDMANFADVWLFRSAENNDVAMASILIEGTKDDAGNVITPGSADIDSFQGAAITIAAELCHIEMVEYLISQNAISNLYKAWQLANNSWDQATDSTDFSTACFQSQFALAARIEEVYGTNPNDPLGGGID